MKIFGELHRGIDQIDPFLSSLPDAVVESALQQTSFSRLPKVGGVFGSNAATLRSAVVALETLSDDNLIARFRSCYKFHTLEETRSALLERDQPVVAVKVNHGFWEHLAGLYGSEDMAKRYRDMNLPLRRIHYFQANFLIAFSQAWSRLVQDRSTRVVPMISITSGVSPTTIKAGLTLRPVQRAALTGMVAYELARTATAGPRTETSQPLPIHDSYAMSESYEQGSVIERVAKRSTKGSAILVIGPRWTGTFAIRGVAGQQYFLAVSDRHVMPFWRQTTAKILDVLENLAKAHKSITVLLQSTAYSPIACSAIMDFAASKSREIEVWDLGRLLDVTADSGLSPPGSPLPSGNSTLVAARVERRPEPTHIFEQIQ